MTATNLADNLISMVQFPNEKIWDLLKWGRNWEHWSDKKDRFWVKWLSKGLSIY